MSVEPLQTLLKGTFSTATWIAVANPWALLSIVLGLVILFQWASKESTTDTSRIVDKLIQSSAQWNTTSLQDNNAILSLMHANYAMAYMNTARSLATDEQIEKWTHVRLNELVKAQQDTQSKSIQALNQVCPITTPPGLSAVYTGWLTKPK